MLSISHSSPISVVGTASSAAKTVADMNSNCQSRMCPPRASKDSAKRLIRSQSSPKKVAAGKVQELLITPMKSSGDFAADKKALTTANHIAPDKNPHLCVSGSAYTTRKILRKHQRGP